MNPEPPEKKKRRTKNSSPPPSPPSSPPSFSLLPDEITVNCLARISRSYYPTLSIVSKSFRSLISSTELYAARSYLGSTEQCVYVCLRDPSYQFPQWYKLWSNPNRTIPDDRTKQKKKKTTGQLLVSIPSSNFPSLSVSVAVGSQIYVIGGPVNNAPSSAVRVLDCCSHTWHDAPSMIVAREFATACVYDGKIYVMKGLEEDEPWAEVFDTKTQSWERLPDPGTEIRNSTIYGITEIEGKIQFRSLNNNIYGYDTKQCKWELRGNQGAMSECLMENVLYSCSRLNGRYRLCWYDIKDGDWKEVKGLNLLGDKYKNIGGSRNKIVSCGGGKLFVIWEGYMKVKHNPTNKKKIWGAEILLEKRDGGELWGKVKWVDVVHTVPIACELLHCLAVSV